MASLEFYVVHLAVVHPVSYGKTVIGAKGVCPFEVARIDSVKDGLNVFAVIIEVQEIPVQLRNVPAVTSDHGKAVALKVGGHYCWRYACPSQQRGRRKIGIPVITADIDIVYGRTISCV